MGELSPRNHYELQGMSIIEAVEALLSAALPVRSTASPADHHYAREVVKELGYLPVAIIQAGCYIRRGSSLRDYIGVLRSRRAKVLRYPTPRQADEYADSVYAVLDATRQKLSEKAQKGLLLLSCFHHTNIPYSMILFAARYLYTFEAGNYLNRTVNFSKAVNLLTEVFSGIDVEGLDELLTALGYYSLVEVDMVSDQRVLRLHPLVQAWAQDVLEFEDLDIYREAAIRIISSCSGKENKHLYRFILPHVHELKPHWLSLHPNDKAAFAEILRAFSPKYTIELLEAAHAQVEIAPDVDELAYARLLLRMGKAYFHTSAPDKCESFNIRALEIIQRIKGPRDLQTIKAQANLGFIYMIVGRYDDARKLQVEVLRLCKEILGEDHLDTITATAKLALTLATSGSLSEAMSLQEDALRRRKRLLTVMHPDTLTSMSNLASTYVRLGRYADAEPLRVEVLERRRILLGDNHVDTVISRQTLAMTYHKQGRHAEARKLQEAVLQSYEAIYEPGHMQIALGMSSLAEMYCALGMLDEAEGLARQAETIQQRVYTSKSVLYARTTALLRRIRWKRRVNAVLWPTKATYRQVEAAINYWKLPNLFVVLLCFFMILRFFVI